MQSDDFDPMTGMAERSQPSERSGTETFSAEEFEKAFGEELHRTLDLGTWRAGNDLAEEYDRMESEVRAAVIAEDTLQERTRTIVFPKLLNLHNAPRNAGVYRARREDLEAVHRGLLFNGGVEACGGSLHAHGTLPLTIYQIGVSLVSYQGDRGTWCQRLYRRELRQSLGDPVEETLRILEGRAAADHGAKLGELVQKTLLDYAERAILLRRSHGIWLMGHGNPVTYEMLTGGGNVELMEACLNVARQMIEGHGRFVFVGSEPRDLHFLTIGNGLLPYEFAIVTTLSDRLETWLHQRRFNSKAGGVLSWDGERVLASDWIPRFIGKVATQVVIGLFRASAVAPAQLFYAHVDHADLAAHIAIADSMLQEQRGSPLLLDLARHVGEAVFGDSLETLAESAYATAGAPWRYRRIQAR